MKDLPKGLATSGAVKIRKRLKSLSGGRVLDVATGEGGFIDTLMKTLGNYESFVGIDKSKEEAESAKKRFKGHRVEIIDMNAEALEFRNDTFDTVCISFSLHHLDKIDKVLSEMKRVLKPRGHFIVQEPFCDGEQNEAQKTDALQHHWHAEIDSLFDIVHNKTLTKQRIEDTVNDLSLEGVEIFESTHYVKCLFCEDMFECKDPKSKHVIKQATKEIDDALDRLRKHSDPKVRARLEGEGEKLRERVKKYGSAPASYLFCIGKK